METLVTLLVIFAGFVLVVLLAIVILWLIDRIMDRIVCGKPKSPEEIAEDARRFRERLLSPRWKELREHFGVAMPRTLQDLYSKRSIVLRTDFEVEPPGAADPETDNQYIARFEPADAQTMEDCWFEIGKNRFPFACDAFGNYYFIELSPSLDDPAVYFVDHDGGDIWEVSTSLSKFVEWIESND